MNIQTVDVKHIYIDIVDYTNFRSIEAQTELISALNQIVKDSINTMKIPMENIIFIPTGDGMCISLLHFHDEYDIHLQLAILILKKLNIYNNAITDTMRKFSIRIGINENTDNMVIDINGSKNIAGSGISYASRILNFADGNQILVGSTVYEKLRQREKYMNSFKKYVTSIKHENNFSIYQYINKKIKVMNNDVPMKFRPTIISEKSLTDFQANYIACCIKHEDFINQNLEAAKSLYTHQIIMSQLAFDELDKLKISRLNKYEPKRMIRDLLAQYKYIQSLDFWMTVDLKDYFELFLVDIKNCFSEPYLFINDFGKEKLKKDFKKIWEDYDLKM